MKNYYLLGSLILIFFSAATAQQVAWAVNVNATGMTHGLVCDRSGNVYLYGSSRSTYWAGNVYQDFPAGNKGSFFSKYSPSGAKLMSKEWDSPLFIHQMIYDGTGNFYFTGSFSGQLSLNGVSISAIGNYDGVLGKLNEQGEILWLTGFGGPKNDLGNSLTFDAQKKSLIVTGGISDTFAVNNHIETIAPQRSILLAIFDLNGKISSFRLIDFLASKNAGNCGYEIVTAASGNYFLLAEQEGKSWDGDTTNAPADGMYVYNLDPSLNIIWSRFIINGECYYGYKCGKMSTGNDDVYVPTYCSSKYGGEGSMMRLDRNDGTAEWSRANKDGTYSGTCSDGSSVYFVGTEGANICPCPENDFGYEVVKSVDAANNEELLTTIYNCSLKNITRNSQGAIYVTGTSYEAVQVGNHTVQGGTFLFALGTAPQEITGTGKEPDAGQFRLYPNPTTGAVEIQLDKPLTGATAEVRVLNLLGQEISSETVNINNSVLRHHLNLGDRVKGSYFVEITSGDIKHVRQLILQ